MRTSPMTDRTYDKGLAGESQAVQYLEKQGMSLVHRRYRAPGGRGRYYHARRRYAGVCGGEAALYGRPGRGPDGRDVQKSSAGSSKPRSTIWRSTTTKAPSASTSSRSPQTVSSISKTRFREKNFKRFQIKMPGKSKPGIFCYTVITDRTCTARSAREPDCTCRKRRRIGGIPAQLPRLFRFGFPRIRLRCRPRWCIP